MVEYLGRTNVALVISSGMMMVEAGPLYWVIWCLIIGFMTIREVMANIRQLLRDNITEKSANITKGFDNTMLAI